MRKRKLAAIIAVAIVAATVVLVTKPWYHRREIRVYFQDAAGLRAGAPVRMAGVDVGSIVSVRVRPELHGSPAEAIMVLRTPYELNVPKDATVSLETAGVLGPTFAEIEIVGASGPPLENRGVLKSKESTKLTTEQIIDRVADIVKQRPCDAQARSEPGPPGKGNDSQPHR